MHITRQGDNCDALQLKAARRRSSHNGISLRRPLCTSVQIKQFRNLRSPILGIRWQGHVQNIEVTYQTGLPPVMEHVVYQTSQLYFRTLTGCYTLSQLTRLCTVKSSCHSADYPTRRGSVFQVALTSDGWTRVARTTTVHPLTCGETLSDEVTSE